MGWFSDAIEAVGNGAQGFIEGIGNAASGIISSVGSSGILDSSAANTLAGGLAASAGGLPPGLLGGLGGTAEKPKDVTDTGQQWYQKPITYVIGFSVLTVGYLISKSKTTR